MVVIGNLYLRFIGAGVRFLRAGEWQSWEVEMYERLGQSRPTRGATGEVILPAVPGLPLWDILCSRQFSGEQKLACYGLAIELLLQAHQLRFNREGERRVFTHGDATARNVICDPVTMTGQWIDFETEHHDGLPELRRCADDLRALIWSSAECLGPGYVDAVARLAVERYNKPGVLGELAQLLARKPNTYHLAQGCLDRAAHALLVRTLEHHMRKHRD
jgi:hypothetical protein